jgi:site-specific DNA-methyltransferase (adenine-specific)
VAADVAEYTGTWSLFRGDALDAYAQWPTPSAIISDGAYGVGGFPAQETPERGRGFTG